MNFYEFMKKHVTLIFHEFSRIRKSRENSRNSWKSLKWEELNLIVFLNGLGAYDLSLFFIKTIYFSVISSKHLRIALICTLFTHTSFPLFCVRTMWTAPSATSHRRFPFQWKHKNILSSLQMPFQILRIWPWCQKKPYPFTHWWIFLHIKRFANFE